MGSKSWPSAPRPCSQIMLAVGFFPVSTSTGGSPVLVPDGTLPPPSLESSVRTTIDTAGGAGLAHDDLRQPRQALFEALPNPARQHFAGRIFEALDFVQAMVIKLVVKRLERTPDIGEILHPALFQRQRADDMHLDMKRVTVQPAAFVPLRHVRQMVRRFEGEYLENFHARNDPW